MKDKDLRFYTEIGIIYYKKRIINNIPTIIISLKDKIELVVKLFLAEPGNVETLSYVIYYNSEINLNQFIYTDYIDDLYKAEHKVDNYDNILEKITLKANIYKTTDELYDEYVASRIKNIVTILKIRDPKDRKKLMHDTNEVFPALNNVTSLEITTVLGKLKIEPNKEGFPEGYVVKLNNAPIVLMETIRNTDNEDKLLIKRYPNKHTVYDDEYINLEAYDIKPDELDSKLIKAILDNIKE